MSEDVYAMPDLTKKVRFQTGDKENKDAEICDKADDVMIYENCWAEGSTPPKSEENTTDDQEQITSVNISSGERNLLKAPAVFLGLLCLILLVAVIVLMSQLIQDKNNWNQLWMDYAKLTNESEKLQRNYSEVERINHNLTQKINQLEDKQRSLEAKNNNLTTERDELRKQIEDFEERYNNLTEERDELKKQLIVYIKDGWEYFNGSFYYTSLEEKNWENSRANCLQKDADLVIINSEEEQEFVERVKDSKDKMWIGLTLGDDGKWKWVDKTEITLSLWNEGEPNFLESERCAEIIGGNNKKWNNARCGDENPWICEKKMPL